MALVAREEALRTLDEGRERIAEQLTPLSDEEMTRPGTVGGAWSVKDLMGHLSFWEEIALRTVREWRSGEPPWVQGVFREGHEAIDRVNAEDVAGKAPRPLDEVRTQAEDVHAKLLETIRGLTEEEWRTGVPGRPGDRPRPLGELLGSVLGAPKHGFGHAFAHLPDLRSYVARVRGAA